MTSRDFFKIIYLYTDTTPKNREEICQKNVHEIYYESQFCPPCANFECLLFGTISLWTYDIIFTKFRNYII